MTFRYSPRRGDLHTSFHSWILKFSAIYVECSCSLLEQFCYQTSPEIYTWHLCLSVCPPRWFDRTLDHNVYGGKVSWGSTSLQKQAHSLLKFLHFYSQHQRRRLTIHIWKQPQSEKQWLRSFLLLFTQIQEDCSEGGLFDWDLQECGVLNLLYKKIVHL